MIMVVLFILLVLGIVSFEFHWDVLIGHFVSIVNAITNNNTQQQYVGDTEFEGSVNNVTFGDETNATE